MDAIDETSAIADPVERAGAIRDVLARLEQEFHAAIAAARAQQALAIREAHKQGITMKEIAALLGVTRARVHQWMVGTTEGSQGRKPDAPAA